MKALRVLVVTQSYHPRCGGIGEHARHLALALKGRGHRVRILTSGPVPRAGELPGPEVVRIGRRFEVPSNGTRASLAFHPAYRRAIRGALADGVDLVHVHSPLEPFLPWAVLQEASVPCVGTFHNAGPMPLGYRLFSRWLAPLAERLRSRIAVSRCAAEYAGRHFPGEYFLVPNGIDPDRFHPAAAPSNGRPPTILFVGSLEPRKGLDVLVEGAAIAARRLAAPLRLLVVGDGSRRDSFLRQARRARLDFRWCGVVDPSILPSYYRQADLLAAPALYGESFGIVLLEALASGLPVVASRIEGFAQLLDGCGAAYLFPPGDASALAGGFEEMLRRGAGGGLRDEARGLALAYDWARIAGLVEGAYRSALGGAPPEAPRLVFSPLAARPGFPHIAPERPGAGGA
jgi:phosphatidyl-myo-inositol alpha-mannosyltransferase